MNRQQVAAQKTSSILTRRSFLAATAAATISASSMVHGQQQESESKNKKFKLKYAPSLGMFRRRAGDDPIEQLKFMAGEGFSAMFDNGLMAKPAGLQKAIAGEMQKLDMTLGPFVAYAEFGQTSFVTGKKESREMLVDRMREAVEVAKRTNGKWTLVVPGRYDLSLEWGYQTANVIDNLKYCAEVCEPSGLAIVIEPLNPWNHPGLFLTTMNQAYQICRAVDSGCCKIVDDLYHQQITEGNLIPNIDRAWDEIAAFHIGDNPGRKEPTTGEINYKNIFKHLYNKGYEGVLCMEHGASKEGMEGEKAVLQAYRACDSF